MIGGTAIEKSQRQAVDRSLKVDMIGGVSEIGRRQKPGVDMIGGTRRRIYRIFGKGQKEEGK